MSNGKHSVESSHKIDIFKIAFKILILFILIFCIYFLFDIYLKFPFIEKSYNTSNSIDNVDAKVKTSEPTEKVMIETVLTVKGAEYLEITGVHINTDNPELSTVTAKLKNNSEQSYENINLRIHLFDIDNIEITFLDYKIDKIEANGEVSTFAALKEDLSTCKNYSIILKNPD